jgi:acyl carrier protein
MNEIFRTVFDDEDITLHDETNAEDIDDWDSLEQINLIVAIENEFGMMFDMSEVADLANVGEMVDLILSKDAE